MTYDNYWLSLEEVLDEYRARALKLKSSFVTQLFCSLVSFVLLLRERGLYHSALQPRCTVLVRDRVTREVSVKVLCDSNMLQEVQHLDNLYHRSPKRAVDVNGHLLFKDPEECYISEIYSVLRTIQTLLLEKEQRAIYAKLL